MQGSGHNAKSKGLSCFLLKCRQDTFLGEGAARLCKRRVRERRRRKWKKRPTRAIKFLPVVPFSLPPPGKHRRKRAGGKKFHPFLGKSAFLRMFQSSPHHESETLFLRRLPNSILYPEKMLLPVERERSTEEEKSFFFPLSQKKWEEAKREAAAATAQHRRRERKPLFASVREVGCSSKVGVVVGGGGGGVYL